MNFDFHSDLHESAAPGPPGARFCAGDAASSDLVPAPVAHAALEGQYSAVVAVLEEGIIVLAEDGRVLVANAAAEHLMGVAPGELTETAVFTVPHPMVDEWGLPLADADWPAQVTLRSGIPQTNVVVGFVAGATTTWVSVNSVLLTPPALPPGSSPDRDGRTVVCSLSNITAAKLARDRLAHLATHDALTHLANRAGIAEHLERLGEAVSPLDHDPAGGSGSLAVLYIDLDHFKTINDSLGHAAGDNVLKEVARRLIAGVRAGDVVGRLAGDEFVVLCPAIGARHEATTVARRILDGLDRPMTVTDAHGLTRSVAVSASVGIAFVGRSGQPAEVLADADVAMYLAKQRGRRRLEVFEETLRAAARERTQRQADLRTVVEEGGLDLAYQPIVDRQGVIEGYEALARWSHPTRGEVPPAVFIPLAEDTGLIRPLGVRVLAQAVSAAARWRAAGSRQYVSINLSPQQLADPALVGRVAGAMTAAGLVGSALCLEIPERALMTDPERIARTLGALKALGVMLAIDDYGTGYSSLVLLQELPLDMLKLDRSFVARLEGSPEAAETGSIIGAVVSLAHALALRVVAKGVETPAQSEILADLKVDGMQGYLHGPPVMESR